MASTVIKEVKAGYTALQEEMIGAIMDIEQNAYHVREHGYGSGVLAGIRATLDGHHGAALGEMAYNLMYEKCSEAAFRRMGQGE